MSSGIHPRCRALDLAASFVIPVWMLLFSALALNTHYALSGAVAEARGAKLRIEALEGGIADLVRQIERPADADASSDDAPRDPAPAPDRRRME
jgi:hypothetical protein